MASAGRRSSGAARVRPSNGALKLCCASEASAATLLAEAITLCAHTSLGTQPIHLFGSDEQKQHYMPDLCAGRKLGAFGLTEPEAGSDAGNTKTRARARMATAG